MQNRGLTSHRVMTVEWLVGAWRNDLRREEYLAA